MKPDLYTKSVLTVIAASLLWICLQNAVSPRAVSAQEPAQVILAGLSKDMLAQGRPTLAVQLEGINIMNPLPVRVVTKAEIAAAQPSKQSKK
jgi:hypothetical protein